MDAIELNKTLIHKAGRMVPHSPRVKLNQIAAYYQLKKYRKHIF